MLSDPITAHYGTQLEDETSEEESDYDSEPLNVILDPTQGSWRDVLPTIPFGIGETIEGMNDFQPLHVVLDPSQGSWRDVLPTIPFAIGETIGNL